MSFLDRIAFWRRGSKSASGTALTRPVTRVEYKTAADFARSTGGYNEPAWVFSAPRKGAAIDAITAATWVYCCASLLAGSVASVPLYAADAAGAPMPASHPLQMLLKRPSQDHRQRAWQTERAYALLLTGSDYLYITRMRSRGASALYPGAGVPGDLYPYAEGEVITKLTKTLPQTVDHFVRQQDQLKISDRDIVRTTQVRPGERERGLSQLEGARYDAASDAEAARWQATSYTNRAIPDGLFVVDEWMTDDQYDATEKRLAAGWMAAKNARAPQLMSGSKWMQLSLNAVEMDFVKSRQATAEAICAAFKIPIALFHGSGATFANLDVSRFLYWEQAAMPLVELLCEGLTEEVAPEFGPGLQVLPDTRKVDAMLPILEKRAALAERFHRLGVPMQQLNDKFRLGLEAYPGWDRSWIESSRVDVESPR